MDYILINGELKHYGVLGMKWGKRKHPKDRSLYAKPGIPKNAKVDGYGDVKPRFDIPKTYAKSTQRIEKRNAKLDSRIDRAETRRTNNANTAESMRKEAKSKYYTGSKKYEKEIAKIDANLQVSETLNKYDIAKAKAKKDKTYKQSVEYRKAKADYHKTSAQISMYGTNGAVRIKALQNRGYSERKAKGRVFVEQVLASAAVYGGIALGSMALKSYLGDE